MKPSLKNYIRQMSEEQLSNHLHNVVEELNRKKAKRQNVDVGFWDSEGNYKEDIQPIDEHDGINEVKQ